jgi:predicted nucleic acid-binding protein
MALLFCLEWIQDRLALSDNLVRRGLLEPFQARRRLHVPTWSTWDRATAVDPRMRRKSGYHSQPDRRSFFQDILLAASARDLGATVITLNTRDFERIGEFIDITIAEPWPELAV